MPVDALGREVHFLFPPQRVVSLVPSITETLFDLGVGESVVGITDFCIFPEGLALPRLGGTKNPRLNELSALRPELVHMNQEENLRRAADEIAAFAPIFVSEPKSVNDVESLIGGLGQLHGCQARAERLVASLQHERSLLPRRTFTFAVAIWKDPWMWCGGDTYVSNLVESAGGSNLLKGFDRYPVIDPAEVTADVIFLPDEPYAFTAADALRFAGRAIGPFPGHLFTWHGSRTILGLRWLRENLGSIPIESNK